jgi:hypothetical protein
VSRFAVIGLAAFTLPVAPAQALAQEASDGLNLSGFAYVESNKTFTTGRILVEGAYLNLITAGQYVLGEDRLTVKGILGTHLEGPEAGELNKANLNVCAGRAKRRFTAQLCATHYFNPTGEPFDDLYAVFADERFGLQAGDVNWQDDDGPYVELFAQGRWDIDARRRLSWRFTAASSFDPEIPYGSAVIEFRTGARFFWNVHVYHQEGYDSPDITLRAGLEY